jgi:CubicO group peptidase (beta-lactamase class C family)
MKKCISVLLLFILCNTISAQLPADSIKAIIKKAVNDKRSKSIIIGIIDISGRKIYSEGIISDKNPVKPDENTIYEIGSITKIFTSLALADMYLKKELDLNDPISKYLPESVHSPVRNGKEITFLNLATHRAVFPRFPFNTDPKDLDEPYADYTEKKLFEYISNFKPDMDFNSRWRYSNTGYGLLGNILTSVSKKKNYEALITENITIPLHMNSTVIHLTPELKKNMADGYSEYGKPVNPLQLSSIEGAGAFRSNVNDMLTFAGENLGLIKSDLFPVLEFSHIKQARKDGDNSDVTLGWTLWADHGRNILFKDGGTPGFQTFIGIDKNKKNGVVVLSNSNNSVKDIGTYILDQNYKIDPYKYPWKLLDTLRMTVKKSGADAAIVLYKKLKLQKNMEFIFDENQLNYLGHELRREKKQNDAVKIFTLNIEEYPELPLVYESLGELYKRSHRNKKKAIDCFEKARELDSQNPHWDFILGRLKNNKP